MWKRVLMLGLGLLSLIGCGSSAPVEPTQEQRQAMQTPEGTVQLYADLFQREQYAQIAPLLTDDFRAALAADSGGDLGKHFRRAMVYSGKLTKLTIEATRAGAGTTAEVDATLVYEHGIAAGEPRTFVLSKTDQGWRIAAIRNRG